VGLLNAPVMRVPTNARQPTEDSQEGFSGGLNSVSNDYALQPNQMRRSDNARLTDIGAATKRAGTQRTSSAVLAAFAVKNGYTWRQSASTTYLLAMCNGALYKATYGTFPMTWTSLGGSFATTTPSFAGFRDTSANVVYIATGGALQKWDGTTLTSLANPKQASGICVYHDRLWGWGVSGFLDSIFYSNLSSATSSIGGDSLGYGASSGGQIVVRTFGQQDIVACAPVNTSLLIFHKRGVSRLTGYGQSDVFVSPEAVTADVGLVGQGAVCVYDNIAYFVSERGVYQANEMQVSPLATPEKPDPVLPQLLTLSSANLALVKATFNHQTRELWVQLPGIGVYIYHTILQSWAGPFVDGYLSPDTTCLFEGLDASNQPIMLRGDASGWVSLCDAPSVYLDNVAAAGTGGTAYNIVVQCHRMYSGDPTRADGYRWAEVLAALSGSASVSVSWNSASDAGTYQIPASTSGNAWGAGTWGAGTWGLGGQAPFYIPLSGTGPFIDITITDSGQAAAQYASVRVSGFAYGRR
jgi:hypothetical protein